MVYGARAGYKALCKRRETATRSVLFCTRVTIYIFNRQNSFGVGYCFKSFFKKFSTFIPVLIIEALPKIKNAFRFEVEQGL